MAKTTNRSSKEKRNYWFKHISYWKQSKLTQENYCRQENLNLSTFVYWRVKFLKLNQDRTTQQQTNQSLSKPLIPIRLNQNLASSIATFCTLKFGNGTHLAIHDLQVLPIILEKVI